MANRAESSIWGNKSRYGEFEIVGASENKPRLLGEGSFGKTFEGLRTDTVAGGVIKESVAVKVLNPQLLSSESRRFQFIQELVSLTKFKHSNLIHYIRCGEDEGEVYYAMELCRGGDLTRLVRRYHVLPEKVAGLIGLQVATGLREVHQRHRLVHRDLKPSNIMLVDELESGLGVQGLAQRLEDQEGLCRIVDFGLVNFALNLKESQQRFVGSPMYASPEQINGQAVDGRSDIYSLGMTLWFLVQGKGPLLDAKGNDLKGVREAMRRHTGPEEYEASLPSHLSSEFRRILAKMVAKRPEERFATAAELQQALREYLSTVAAPDEAKFTALRLASPLGDVYTLEESLPSRTARRCCVARRKSTGERVKLSIVANATAEAETEKLTDQLCALAQLSRPSGRLETLLRVREVLWAEDVVAFTEELPPHLTLAEVVAARRKAGRPVAFTEAVALLRPIAEALDSLIEQGQETIFLRGDEVWLTQAGAGESEAKMDPLAPWSDLRAHFSAMCLPDAVGSEVNLASSLQETVSASMQIADATRHPVPTFASLVYFVVTGAEVAAAAQFTPTAYVPAANLGAPANDVIRDLLCRTTAWTHVTAVLKDLCVQEGVVWQPLATHVSTQRSTGTAGTGPSVVGSAAGRTFGSGTSGQFGGSVRWAAGGEKVCEIIGPGVVCSPYDAERRPQEVPAQLWVPSGRVTCTITQKIFHLPRKLELLVAQVVAPGVIQSPYAAPGVTQVVPWDDWLPGGEIVCAESGRRIVLPAGLPEPEGILSPQSPGVIISPYDRKTAIPIPPERWEPGTGVLCPVAQANFILPRVLPPLVALADVARPGVLATPYAPGRTWSVEPVNWVAAREVKCPMTDKPLQLPPIVEHWVAEARVVDVARRLVSNPYRPDATVPVPATSWNPGATVTCPGTGRAIALPADLPLLSGEVVENRPGIVRSPFSGEVISVAPKDWTPGVAVTCPRTRMRFLLPERLPEWIPPGNLSGLATGAVRSPYDPFSEMTVPPADWLPNQILKCPETGRPFRLPGELPMLEARVKAGHPGKVTSPFSGKAQEVALEDWIGGRQIECAKTGRIFRLPSSVEEWLVDGAWVPGAPGWVRSPFPPHPEFELTPAQWRPRQVLACPATQRRFRLPAAEPFPTIELEKDAFQYALAEPESTEEEAASALRPQHRTATAALVQAIWERHELASLEKRRSMVQVAEVVTDQPGTVRSPYGAKPLIEVPPALWIEPGASMLCSETGRRFLLPAKKSPLFALPVPGVPGSLLSPYQPESPFQISPEQWQPGRMIRCEYTGHPLQMPANLPEWTPEGTLKSGQPGLAFSPFGRRGAVRIPGANWASGARVTCLETGRIFVLPDQIPPLVAKAVEGHPGQVLSPYAADCTVRVRHRDWTPGARVLCPVTQRILLLPESLPEWRQKQFPWKSVLAGAACAALALLGWLVWSKSDRARGKPAEPRVVSGLTPPAPPPAAESPQLGPQPLRVVFTGGFELEDWPRKRELPESLRAIYRSREVPLKMEGTRLVAALPVELDEEPAADIELRLDGWKPLKITLPHGVPEQFTTYSASFLPQADEPSVNHELVIRNQTRLERQRVALPVSIIPEGGTDYEFLDAAWVGRLSGEPDAAPPPVNPIRLRIVKGEIDRPLPTGIYDFTLHGAASGKVTVVPHSWKAGVVMSGQPLNLYTLPPSLAGGYLGLMFTVVGKDQQLEGGYFFSIAVTQKIAGVTALMNPIPIKGGEVIKFESLKPDQDELGIISHVKLTDPKTLEFDASLRMFDYHWTLKVEENGTRFMYGRMVEFNEAYIEQEKTRMEQMFRAKARVAQVPALAANRIGALASGQYRTLYEEYLKEAREKAKYLTSTYPDMKVKGSSIYFALHSAQDLVRVVRLKNGDWDLQKVPR